MECLDLMALDFKSQMFLAFAQIPSYFEWFVEKADFTSTYAYERRVLKLLAWGEPTRPWRLKSPAHVMSLNYLDTAFPDARFVMTHRDPTDVISGALPRPLKDIPGITLDVRRIEEQQNQTQTPVKEQVTIGATPEPPTPK